MRPQWMLLVTSFVCLLLLAACGQGNGTTTNPATATTAPVAPSPTSAAASRGAATATTAPARQAAATTPTRQAGPTPTAASITLGKPVVVPSDEGEVVVVSVTNPTASYVSFMLMAKPKGSKIGSQPFFSITRMPAGATWTVAMIANEMQVVHYDLLDLSVEGFIVVQRVVDPAMARQLSSTQPAIAIDGARATADIKVKNDNDTRVTFTLQVLLTRSGTVVGVAQKDVVLEPGESQALSLPIEGVTEGAEAQTAIINVGD